MIDLHTHTFFSDGVLIPSEMVCRALAAGYKTISLSDHVDFSNMDFVIPRLVEVSKLLSREYKIQVIPGAELTYVPPRLISKAMVIAKKLGAKIVLVHGETVVEPVPKGTNHAAIVSKVDILAHPGMITNEDVKLASKNKVYLELTTRRGHCQGNKHVASLAKAFGAKLILNTDAHQPQDLLTDSLVKKILKQASLPYKDFIILQKNAYALVKNL